MALAKGVNFFGYIACLLFLRCLAAQDGSCDQPWHLSVDQKLNVSWSGDDRPGTVTVTITTEETNGQTCEGKEERTVKFNEKSTKFDTPCSNALYYVTVRVTCGTLSQTQTMVARTPPGAPTIQSAIPTNTSATVSWMAPPGKIASYTVVLEGGLGIMSEHTDSTSYIFTKLLPLTKYSVKVSASNEDQTGKFSEEVNFQTLEGVPREPRDLKASAIETDKITLTWKEPQPRTGIVLRYEIVWIEDGLTNGKSKTTEDTAYVISGLHPFTTYHIKVAAESSVGWGVFSEVTVTTELAVPDPPVLHALEPTNTSVSLKWDMPAGYRGPDPTYTLRWKGAGSDDYVTMDRSVVFNNYKVEGLMPFTTYHMQVRAQNRAGLGNWSSEVTVTTRTGVPSAPRNLRVESQSATSVLVSWDLPSPANGVIQKYRVAWNAKSRRIGIDYTTDTSYEATLLTPYTEYDFQVSAKTDWWGDWSPALRVRTNVSVPSAPLNLTEIGKTNTSIQIEWLAPLHKNGPTVTYVVKWRKVDETSNADDYYYFDEGENTTSTGDLLYDISEEVDEPAYDIKNLDSYTTYSIEVCAKTSAGEGPYTDPLVVKTVAGIPSSPVGVRTANVRSADLTLLWQVPKSTNGPLKGYVIHWGIKGIGGSNVWTNQSRYEAAGLRPYTEYVFMVAAETEGGQGPYSSVITTTGIATPSSPRDITPSEVTPNSILLEWSSPEHPNGPFVDYIVHWREQSADSTSQAQETNATSYRIRDLFPDANYSVRIHARTEAGGGPWTKMLYVRTKKKDHSSAIIAGSVVGSFLVLFAIACVFLLYLAKKKGGIKNIIRSRAVNKSSDTLHTTISVPLEVVNDSGKVRIENFDEHVLKLMCNGYYQLAQEYEKLGRESPAFPSDEAKKSDNLTKNRWVKIMPFDYSRVKLRPVGDEVEPDFINASYVPGYSHLLEYIATQGPLPNTVNDFWRMVWQESVFLMVMLTQCVERAKRTCERYWPSAGTTARYGDIEVHSLSESITPAYIQRLLLVTQGGKQRHIVHLHYMNWPVSGCPKSPDDFLTFVRTVRSQVSCGVTGPMLVHCSAGIGRTGTFIAVDRLYQQLNRQCTDVDIYGTVLDMRRYRANLVQTEEQYYFIYLCAQRIIHEKRQEKENDYGGGIYSN